MSVGMISRTSLPAWPCSQSGPQVDPRLVRELCDMGFHRPIASFTDPRLRLPELLLMGGWEREQEESSIVYSKVVEESSPAGQKVIFAADSVREVVTWVGDRVHRLHGAADGSVKESRR